MKYLISILALIISTATSAQEKAISKEYNCLSKGCSVTCLNEKNRWSTLTSGATSVTVNHYSSGNVEFILKYQEKI